MTFIFNTFLTVLVLLSIISGSSICSTSVRKVCVYCDPLKHCDLQTRQITLITSRLKLNSEKETCSTGKIIAVGCHQTGNKPLYNFERNSILSVYKAVLHKHSHLSKTLSIFYIDACFQIIVNKTN